MVNKVLNQDELVNELRKQIVKLTQDNKDVKRRLEERDKHIKLLSNQVNQYQQLFEKYEIQMFKMVQESQELEGEQESNSQREQIPQENDSGLQKRKKVGNNFEKLLTLSNQKYEISRHKRLKNLSMEQDKYLYMTKNNQASQPYIKKPTFYRNQEYNTPQVSSSVGASSIKQLFKNNSGDIDSGNIFKNKEVQQKMFMKNNSELPLINISNFENNDLKLGYVRTRIPIQKLKKVDKSEVENIFREKYVKQSPIKYS